MTHENLWYETDQSLVNDISFSWKLDDKSSTAASKKESSSFLPNGFLLFEESSHGNSPQLQVAADV